MKKRIFLTSCILCLALSLLGGCGNQSDNTSDNSQQISAQSPTVQSDYRAEETGSPTDTTTPEDTASPTDTATPEDTTSPSDTTTPEDTTSPSDTASPAVSDTSTPETTDSGEGGTTGTPTPASAEAGNDGELADGKLVVGINAAFPPYEYYGKEGLTGIDVGVMNAIGEQLGVEVTYRNLEFSALLTALQNGEIEAAISTITATDNRATYANLSDSYLTEIITAVVKTNSVVNSVENLSDDGVKVAVVSGSLADLYFSAEHPDGEVVRVSTAKKAFQAVKKGTADCALLEDSQAQALVEGKSKFTTFNYLTEDYVIALPMTSPNLLSQVNSAISTLKSSGAIQLIYNEYMGQ